MSIAIGSDHAGYPLKKFVIDFFEKNKIDYCDLGAFSEEQVDYPDFAHKVAQAVSEGKHESGIVICGTGIGVSIVANKHKNIRAALCCSVFMAEMARKHNNANILALGARTTEENDAINIVRTFLNTDFEGGRHAIRVNKISAFSEK